MEELRILVDDHNRLRNHFKEDLKVCQDFITLQSVSENTDERAAIMAHVNRNIDELVLQLNEIALPLQMKSLHIDHILAELNEADLEDDDVITSIGTSVDVVDVEDTTTLASDTSTTHFEDYQSDVIFDSDDDDMICLSALPPPNASHSSDPDTIEDHQEPGSDTEHFVRKEFSIKNSDDFSYLCTNKTELADRPVRGNYDAIDFAIWVRILSSKEWFSNFLLHRSFQILHSHSTIRDLAPPTLLLNESKSYLTQNPRSQLIGFTRINENHWIVVHVKRSPNIVTIYNSMSYNKPTTISRQIRKMLQSFYPDSSYTLEEDLLVQQQDVTDWYNCGAFAVAFAQCLFQQEKPSDFDFDVSKMRSCILLGVQSGTMPLFARSFKVFIFSFTSETFYNCCRLVTLMYCVIGARNQ